MKKISKRKKKREEIKNKLLLRQDWVYAGKRESFGREKKKNEFEKRERRNIS